MLRRIVIGAAILTALAALGLCGAVVLVGMRLAAPHRGTVTLPATLTHVESVTIDSASGATVRGWFLAGTRPAAVVLAHGVWANRNALVRRAVALNAAGYGVLAFDLQAHGESGGARITFGKLEARDMASAVAHMHQRLPCHRIGVIGISLGGAAALLGDEPLAVDALVIESVYSDIHLALENRLRAGLGPVVGAVATLVLTPLFKLLLPPILGVTPEELRPIDRIARVKSPILVASGILDDRTSLDETRQTFERAPAPKRLWTVDGAAHVDLEVFAPEEYRRTVYGFLDEHLATPVPGCVSAAPNARP
jgi:fermentation-respiration switch protein FrsA (DUF1100 family)